MALDFKLPDIGEGIAEGEIVKWLVKLGDSVAEHQPVVEVMTDKATVEIPAPQAGRILELRAKEGDIVPVGSVLFVLGGDGGEKSAVPKSATSGALAEKKATAAEEEISRPAGKQETRRLPAGGQARPASASATASNAIAFKLPDIGEGIAEGEIIKWLVKEGDSVSEHQPVVEVMTDKATVEIPSPAAGVITSIKVQPGTVVPIGTVLFNLNPERSGSIAGTDEPSGSVEPAKKEPASAARKTGGRTGGDNGSVRAVPSARRVARELGIELGQVPGTGRGGIIRRQDVEAFGRERSLPPEPQSTSVTEDAVSMPRGSAAPLTRAERETRTPFRGVRRKISEVMSRSKSTAAHFTVVEEVDVTELVRLRESAKRVGEEQSIKVTYMPFIMKATALALARHPELNGTLDEKAQELVVFHYVNLGVATDTAQGLLVPVIREVQGKSVLVLASELNDLADRARRGKIKPEELQGGTFTITNAGNIGGIFATPIINYPEIGILGVHRIVKRPGVIETPRGDEIAIRSYMCLSVSVDHRLTDGANAARFLVTMKKLLETPGLLSL